MLTEERLQSIEERAIVRSHKEQINEGRPSKTSSEDIPALLGTVRERERIINQMRTLIMFSLDKLYSCGATDPITDKIENELKKLEAAK